VIDSEMPSEIIEASEAASSDVDETEQPEQDA